MAQFTAKMQKAFAHFAEFRNKSEAYRHAYSCERMLDSTVQTKAWELFNHPLMAAAVSSMQAAAAVKVQIDAAWVLKRAALLADFNINRFVRGDEDTPHYYDLSAATEDDWYCITAMAEHAIKRNRVSGRYEVGEIRIKPGYQLKALEMVGKHVEVQAFQEHVEHTGAVAFTRLNAEEYKQARREMLNDDDC